MACKWTFFVSRIFRGCYHNLAWESIREDASAITSAPIKATKRLGLRSRATRSETCANSSNSSNHGTPGKTTN